MQAFQYARPQTVAEALALLAEHGAGSPHPGRRHRPGHQAAQRRDPADGGHRPQAGCRAGTGDSPAGRAPPHLRHDGHARRRARRRGAAALPGAGRGCRLGGIGADPQPGHGRGEHLQRLAGGRHRPAAAGVRGVRAGGGPRWRAPHPHRRLLRPFRARPPCSRGSWSPGSTCLSPSGGWGRPTPGSPGGGAPTWRRSPSASGWTRPGSPASPTEAWARARSWCSTRAGSSPTPPPPTRRRPPSSRSLLAGASPSPRSMRAGPEYRLAMLRVLGRRALQTAIERLAKGKA